MFKVPLGVSLGLRVLQALAARDGGCLTAQALAEGLGESPDSVRKVLNALARDGLVLPIRGAAGGFSSAGELRMISVLEVVEAVWGELSLSCPLHPAGSGACCPLGLRTRAEFSQLRSAWRTTTLDQLPGLG